MHSVKYQVSKLRKIWLFAAFFVALGAFFVSSLGAGSPVNAATSTPISNESPPTDIFSKGGTVKWLYYGNIRIDNNKKGEKKKVWDYALNPETGYYELGPAGYCQENSEKPNDYMVVQESGSVARFVVLKPTGAQSESCDRKSQTIGNPERKTNANALFYQISNEKNVIKMWNFNELPISFKKTPKADGWSEVYKRVDDPSSVCSDMVAKTNGGDWIFMPMIEWTDGVKDDYGFIDAAKSEAAASILGSHTLDECRTAAFEVVSVFKTGIKERDELGPAVDYRLYTSLDVSGNDDHPIQLCGDKEKDINALVFNDLPKYTNINDAIEKGVDDAGWGGDGYDIKKDWNGADPPSDGHNWVLDCERTDEPGGDEARHSLKVWDNKAYGMTESSNERLIDMSHVKLYSYAHGGQDTNDDGYKADGGVALISPDEVSGADPNLDTDPLDDEDDGGAGDESTTCAIDKIGWIICPVLEKTADAADKAFEFLSKGFLQTDAELVETGGGTYDAWKIMRDFANAVFVVVFLIILYSQMTGAGISNYGVKKMLPKLIAGAILVNISFFICQIAVDLSNILGWSLKGMLSGIADSINVSSGDNSAIATGSGGLGLAGLALVILAAGAIVFLMLPILGGVILTAIIVLVTIIIILLLRKALIILLIFVSPLAFVAYLLPNTESLFNKWKDMFIKLLMVFPIVALLFGAGELASRVILAAGNGADYQSTDASAASATLGLVAAGVAVAPLLAVWGVLQGALAAAGAIGGKIRGATDKGGGFVGGKVGGLYKNSAYSQGREQRRDDKKNFRQNKLAGALAGDEDASKWHKLRARSARGVLGRGVGEKGKYAQQQLLNSATRTADKAYEEGVEGARLGQVGLSNADVASIAATGMHNGKAVSEHEYAAALDRTMKGGTFTQRREALEQAATHTSETMRARAVQGAAAKGDQAVYGKDFGDEIIRGNVTDGAAHLRSEIVRNAAAGKVSASDLVHSDSGTALIVDAVNRGGNATALENVHRAADEVATNEHTASKLTTNIARSLGNLN